MKNRKALEIKQIKPLKATKAADGTVSGDRYSLYEDRENFCIATVPAGTAVVKDGDKIIQVGDHKIGQQIIAIEEDITLADGSTTKAWYHLTAESVDAYVQKTVNRDVNLLIVNETALRTAEQAKKLKSFDLTAAMDAIN